MRKDSGKIFEQNFRKSVPKNKNFYYYRIKDSATSFYGGNDNLRFSQKNIADSFLFTVYNNGFSLLLILELKHHFGKSLPFSCIRDNQIKEMYEASEYHNVRPMLLCFFEDVEKTYALDINNLVHFMNTTDRKSIPISYFEEYGYEIETKKLKTNYRYNIEKFVEDI